MFDSVPIFFYPISNKINIESTVVLYAWEINVSPYISIASGKLKS